MVFRDQNGGQRPAFALERLDDGSCFRGVDRGGGLGGGIVDQISEIVGETGEQANLGGHTSSMIQNKAAASGRGHIPLRFMALTPNRQGDIGVRFLKPRHVTLGPWASMSSISATSIRSVSALWRGS